MTEALWIALAIALLAGLGYFFVLRNLYRKSGELDKGIDYRKMRQWNDGDGAD